MSESKKGPIIADYDLVNYDYESYWKGREYEDEADKIALLRLLEEEAGNITERDVYIDIGGSYGREAEIYNKYFKHIILLDYSLNSLKKAKSYLDKLNITNVTYIAANLYFMPFKNSSISAGQMVRVMHHIKDSKKALNEFDRVISKFFILEFANKSNLKSNIRFILKGRFNELASTNPVQQEFRTTSQGSSGENQIFLNYSPKDIKAKISDTNFFVKDELSASNFRSPRIKRYIPKKALIKLEKVLQKPLSKLNFGPSMYYLLQKENINKEMKKDFVVENILACPKCKSNLSDLKCINCNLEFSIKEGVYDLRYTAQD